jgi:hypothetical protein
MSKAGTKRVSRVAMSVAAVGVATTVAGVAATQPASISAPLADLAALIIVGSSTHPDGSGNEEFFNGMFDALPYNAGGDLTHVNFFTGPAGINQALQANAGDKRNAVLASGWGAANASLLLMQLQAQHDPVLAKTVFILDNNVARPDGGFGTRYPWFALIGVNPFPTPTDTAAAAVVDVGYQYDYNSNAPADVLNPVAAVNSLVAYLYRHLNQNELVLPVNTDGSPVTCGTADICGITDTGRVLACPDLQCGTVQADERITAYVTKRGNTTYVTYTSNGLPLTNLIRDVVPFGNVIADLTEPLLTEIVNSAYPNGNPIPADASRYQPATPFSSLSQLAATAVKSGPTVATEPTTTSTPAIAADAKPTDAKPTDAKPTDAKATVTEKTTDDEPKPLTNVVRDSEKAVPQSVGGDTTAPSQIDPVAAVDEPTDDEPAQSATTSGEPNTNSGTGTEAGTS